MLLPASYENIMALSIGTACAIEMCKPGLAWALTAHAAALCQSLGYHRFSSMQHDSEQEQRSKTHLFWMIYMFDKQLSLRLGRASQIQDWDVSLPLLTAKQTPLNGFEQSNLLFYWVEVARVQGRVYEALFSPAAARQTAEQRARVARGLVEDMDAAWRRRGEASVMDYTNLLSPNETEVPSRRKRVLNEARRTALQPEFYMQGQSVPYSVHRHAGLMRAGSFDRVEDVFFHTDVVVHYSTCALALRAASPDTCTPSTECLAHARAALLAHMRCNAQFNTHATTELWAGYMHWSILQVRKIPTHHVPTFAADSNRLR